MKKSGWMVVGSIVCLLIMAGFVVWNRFYSIQIIVLENVYHDELGPAYVEHSDTFKFGRWNPPKEYIRDFSGEKGFIWRNRRY